MLELRQVSKAFGDKRVIDRLDLTIEEGSILAVVGPSGGGKQPCCVPWLDWRPSIQELFTRWTTF